MKAFILPLILSVTSLAPLMASDYDYDHGDGGYSNYSSASYTPMYQPTYSPPPQPSVQANPARQTPSVQELAAAQQRAAEQRAQTANAVREREVARQEQVRQETFAALDRIAQQNSSRPVDTSVNATLEAVSQATAARQQQGYDCIVSQSGGMDCYLQPNMNDPVSYTGQEIIRVPEAYSGSLSGGGYNNPAMQSAVNNGPIPQGIWNGAEVRQQLHDQNHSNVIALEPAAGTENYQRDSFLIHGDNISNPSTASNGCVIAPRDVRQTLAEMLNSGGQLRLEVRP